MATPIPINRCEFSEEEIIRATGAAANNGLSDRRVSGVSIDSRTIAPGNLFVGLRGVRDGHEFLASAAQRGAGAAIVERGRSHPALRCFEVDDTLAALGGLARFHLKRVRASGSLRTISIGGAAGKTTTKELTAALARVLFGEILATPGNLNNLIGVPMTLLTLEQSAGAAVIECGTNQRGEIAKLGNLVEPDVTLVLNVDVEHTEGLGSLEGVADEEAAIFAFAQAAVVSADEPMLVQRVPKGTRTVTFSLDSPADVRVTARTVVAPGRQQVSVSMSPAMVETGIEPRVELTLSMLGAASALNAAAALATASVAFARPFGREQLSEIVRALALVSPVEGRLCTREIGGIIVIDDTYNANPRSVRAALAAACESAAALHSRLVVALGDMLELGALSAQMHVEAVREVYRSRPHALIAVGPEMAAAVGRIEDPSPAVVHLAGDSDEAGRIVRTILRPADVLLVKGSRGIAMERIIDALIRTAQ